VYAHISSAVGGVYAAEGRLPTLEDYDRLLVPPSHLDPRRDLSEITISTCDVMQPVTWHIGVYLQPQHLTLVPESRFVLTLRTSEATAPSSPSIVYTGGTCCGAIMHWRVPFVPSTLGLSVDLNVTSGAVHAVVLQYDSCARYDSSGTALATCPGLCDIGWVTLWDPITGGRSSEAFSTTTVAMGETLAQSDKRRAGTWYIGIKALTAEAARYEMRVSLAAPAQQPPKPYCSGHERFCASATQRGHELPLTTSAETRRPELGSFASAAAPGAHARATRRIAGTLAHVGVASVAAAGLGWLGGRGNLRPR